MIPTDEIISMAREAGFTTDYLTRLYIPTQDDMFCVDAELKSFAALVSARAAKDEREACLACYSPDDTATDWADKIRARGDQHEQ